MYHNLGDKAADLVLAAIDERLATKVEGASFVAGVDDQYRIDHFRIGLRVVRCEYNVVSTRYYMEEITGLDLADFEHFHKTR